ncbi:MAG: hypothetical protein U0Z70_20600 [Thermomicrobiales bacterium]
MKAAEVLLELLERDVEVTAAEGQLHLRHVEDALSAELVARVREQKSEILHLLADPDELRLAMVMAMFDAECVDEDVFTKVSQLDLFVAEEEQ